MLIKKITLLITVVVFAGSVLYSCSMQTEQKAETLKKPEKDLTRYPNDDSELALLMRDMYTDAEQMKLALEQGKLPEDFRRKFTAIHTAIPTDSTVRTPGFNALGDAFLVSMNKVYEGKEQVKDFNMMVRNCVACHQTVCPGPIKRIQKLHIAQK